MGGPLQGWDHMVMQEAVPQRPEGMQSSLQVHLSRHAGRGVITEESGRHGAAQRHRCGEMTTLIPRNPLRFRYVISRSLAAPAVDIRHISRGQAQARAPQHEPGTTSFSHSHNAESFRCSGRLHCPEHSHGAASGAVLCPVTGGSNTSTDCW